MNRKEQNQIHPGRPDRGNGPLTRMIVTGAGQPASRGGGSGVTAWFNPYGLSLLALQSQAGSPAASPPEYEEGSFGVGASSAEAKEKARREREEERIREKGNEAMAKVVAEIAERAFPSKGSDRELRRISRGEAISRGVEALLDAIPQRAKPPPDRRSLREIDTDAVYDPYLDVRQRALKEGREPTEREMRAYEMLPEDVRRQAYEEARATATRERSDRAYSAAQRQGRNPLTDEDYLYWRKQSDWALQDLQAGDQARAQARDEAERRAQAQAAAVAQSDQNWREFFARPRSAPPAQPPVTPGLGRYGSTQSPPRGRGGKGG